MSASQGASIGTAMTVAWVAGWLSGLWVAGGSRRRTARFIRARNASVTFTPGPVARSNCGDAPVTTKPVIRPTGQGIWQPQPRLQQGNPNPPPRNP